MIRLPLVDGRDIRFRQIPAVNGLSQTRAGTTVQDRLGFLWFGTQYGLDRFDGSRFKVFRHEPGDPNSLGGVYVRSLLVDHSGTLWVGCDQSLDRFDPVTETFTHFRIGRQGMNENDGPAINISEDHYGKLWLATAKGLFMLDPANGHTVRYTHDPNDPSSLSGNEINFADEDRQGTFWVASSGELDAFDRKSGKVTRHIRLSNPSPFTFHEDRFGSFWIGRDSPHCPLAVLDRKDSTLNCYSFYEGAHRATTIAGIYAMLESRDGTMWMATSGAGLLKYDRVHNTLVRYKNHPEDNESLGADSVIYLFEDNESDIWVDLHEAAPFFFSERPSAFENFTHQRGQLRRSLVTSIYEDRRKVLWIGSTGALNRIDRANGTNTVPPGVGAKGEVLSIIEDPSGALVAGTFWQGLQRLNPATGQTEPYLRSRGALSNQSEHPIMRLFIDHLGTLWAATWGGLRRLDPATGQFTTYKPDPQDTVDYSDIKEDSNGKLWLGGESGLQRFDPTTGQFTIYKHDPDNPKSVSDHRITSVFFDRSGGMWLGTQNGFDRFDPRSGTAKAYYEKDGLAGNVASCILEDERGTLWIGTNNGLSNFDSLTEKFNNYSVADGLPGPDLSGWSTCFKSPPGEMFFGGFSGATAFYPSRIVASSFVPKTVLTDFRLSGSSVPIGSGSPLSKSITYTDSITLSHRQNIFAIEFSALSYFNAVTNRYRYKLEGLDNQWHEVGSDQRVASYTTLPKGKYKFRVEGATSRGAWDEPGAALDIEILPPWWGTWWFLTACAALICILAWMLYRARLKRIAHQFNLTLEAQVNERTRIARDLHDTLLQSFHGLLFRIQAARNMLPRRPEEACEALDGVIGKAEQAITEGRDAIQNLRAEPAAEGDLVHMLTATGKELAGSRDANPDSAIFGVTVEGARQTLSPILQVEAYRIARELLRNAFLHARARKIEAEIRYEDRLFRLRIRDDGKGIDPKVAGEGRRAGHWGLPGIRERAKQIGAQLEFWSEAGAGTEVELTVPASVAYEASRNGGGFKLFRRARNHEHRS